MAQKANDPFQDISDASLSLIANNTFLQDHEKPPNSAGNPQNLAGFEQSPLKTPNSVGNIQDPLNLAGIELESQNPQNLVEMTGNPQNLQENMQNRAENSQWSLNPEGNPANQGNNHTVPPPCIKGFFVANSWTRVSFQNSRFGILAPPYKHIPVQLQQFSQEISPPRKPGNCKSRSFKTDKWVHINIPNSNSPILVRPHQPIPEIFLQLSTTIRSPLNSNQIAREDAYTYMPFFSFPIRVTLFYKKSKANLENVIFPFLRP